MRKLNYDTFERLAVYNIDYQKSNGKSPSYREIMQALNLGSLATVQRYVRALANAKRINLTETGNIETLPQFKHNNVKAISLLSNIADKNTLFAKENIEQTYCISNSLFGDGELFMLTAKGHDMLDVGIKENDLLVIRRQNYANDGDIVVVLLNNEATLKRIYHKDGKVILHSENTKKGDIILERCDIQGVLVGEIRRY